MPHDLQPCTLADTAVLAHHVRACLPNEGSVLEPPAVSGSVQEQAWAALAPLPLAGTLQPAQVQGPSVFLHPLAGSSADASQAAPGHQQVSWPSSPPQQQTLMQPHQLLPALPRAHQEFTPPWKTSLAAPFRRSLDQAGSSPTQQYMGPGIIDPRTAVTVYDASTHSYHALASAPLPGIHSSMQHFLPSQHAQMVSRCMLVESAEPIGTAHASESDIKHGQHGPGQQCV